MIDFYSYKGVISDTKQNWINLVGCKQFCLLIFKGDLINQRLYKSDLTRKK